MESPDDLRNSLILGREVEDRRRERRDGEERRKQLRARKLAPAAVEEGILQEALRIRGAWIRTRRFKDPNGLVAAQMGRALESARQVAANGENWHPALSKDLVRLDGSQHEDRRLAGSMLGIVESIAERRRSAAR